MFIDKNSLLLLIEAEVSKALVEQDEPEDTPAGGDATPEIPDAPAGGDDADIEAPEGEAGDDAEGVEGAEGDLEGGDVGDLGGAGGEGDLEGEEGAEGGAGGGIGGGFGGGFGGGGGGFGDEGEAGLAADEEEEADTVTTVGPEDVEIPADPVMAITDDAIQMLNKTRQPSVILQNVKHSIQRYFPEPMDATPIIKTLWDTEDLVLRDVARRLLLFIKGI